METSTLEKALDVLKQLSPENQAYLLSMAQLAEAAERNAKQSAQQQAPSNGKPTLPGQ